MSKYKYSETERQINSVLKHQDEDLKSIHFPSLSEADATVAKADALLRRLGYQPDAIKGLVPVQPRKTMVIPTWEQCCAEAETHVGTDCELESLFTEEELRSNLLQFGSIGEEEQTIAEIVQGMYYEGYDFIHFCSMSIPAMLVEVIVRLGYSIKRIKEGHEIKDAIPFSLNREKHPKLATMLFIAHAGATAANAGKVYFTHNPVAINYPQWIAFAIGRLSCIRMSFILLHPVSRFARSLRSLWSVWACLPKM